MDCFSQSRLRVDTLNPFLSEREAREWDCLFLPLAEASGDGGVSLYVRRRCAAAMMISAWMLL